MVKFYDTNVLLELQSKILDCPFVISSKTLEEIEGIKTSDKKSEEVKYKARRVAHLLEENEDKYEVFVVTNKNYELLESMLLPVTPDNLILSSAYLYNQNIEDIVFVTNDINCKIIGRNIFNLTVIKSENTIEDNEYTGYKDVTMSDKQMEYFYGHLNENIYACDINEYLIIRNSEKSVVDKRKWNGEIFIALSYKQINNDFTGKIKPKNLEQELAFDMIQDNDSTIKVLSGKQGSGKTMLMVAHALQQAKKGKKIMWVRNTIEVKDTKPIGYLPADKNSKLAPFAGALADYCGGMEGLNKLIEENIIEIEHLGFLRGRNLVNTCLLINEAGNISKEHLQLLVGRIGEGSSLWLDGDLLQIDSKIFESNNGLESAINNLKGQKLFGFVKLKDCERSETAKLADLLN